MIIIISSTSMKVNIKISAVSVKTFEFEDNREYY